MCLCGCKDPNCCCKDPLKMFLGVLALIIFIFALWQHNWWLILIAIVIALIGCVMSANKKPAKKEMPAVKSVTAKAKKKKRRY